MKLWFPWLGVYGTQEYPPFAITVDVVVLTLQQGELCCLLVRRSEDPFVGKWGLPGGLIQPEEDLPDAAYRQLADEAGLGRDDVALEQLATYGDPERDPRMRVVSVAWLALGANLPLPTSESDASPARWVPVHEVLDKKLRLAFDHQRILADAVDRARAKLENSPAAAAFCESEFTVGELRAVYDAVWGTELDPRNFHRKVTSAEGFLQETGARTTRGGGRPAMLYRLGGAQRIHPAVLRPGA